MQKLKTPYLPYFYTLGALSAALSLISCGKQVHIGPQPSSQAPASSTGGAGKSSPSILEGNGAPQNSTGSIGSYYIDNSTHNLYIKNEKIGWYILVQNYQAPQNPIDNMRGKDCVATPIVIVKPVSPPVDLDKEKTLCDQIRQDLREESFRQTHGMELVRLLDRLYEGLSDSEHKDLAALQPVLRDSARTEAEHEQAWVKMSAILEGAMNRIGMKSVGERYGELYGDLETSSDGSHQTYLGVYRKGAVIAGVYREIAENNEIRAMKYNWSPSDKAYTFSSHILTGKPGEQLNDRNGIPEQNLQGTAQHEDNMFEWIERNSRMKNCRGITHMTQDQQRKFGAAVQAGQTK